MNINRNRRYLILLGLNIVLAAIIVVSGRIYDAQAKQDTTGKTPNDSEPLALLAKLHEARNNLPSLGEIQASLNQPKADVALPIDTSGIMTIGGVDPVDGAFVNVQGIQHRFVCKALDGDEVLTGFTIFQQNFVRDACQRIQ